MIKNITQFKCVINELECVFSFEANCPTTVAKEGLLECLKWIGNIEDASREAEKAQEAERCQDEEEEEPKGE